MREDQARKLNALTERLADTVIKEADPWEWPGAGVDTPAEWTKEERGDRYWCKKNAAASLTLLTKLVQLGIDWRTRKPGQRPGDDEDIDETIRNAEKQAAKMLEKTMNGVRHRASHGGD